MSDAEVMQALETTAIARKDYRLQYSELGHGKLVK